MAWTLDDSRGPKCRGRLLVLFARYTKYLVSPENQKKKNDPNHVFDINFAGLCSVRVPCPPPGRTQIKCCKRFFPSVLFFFLFFPLLPILYSIYDGLAFELLPLYMTMYFERHAKTAATRSPVPISFDNRKRRRTGRSFNRRVNVFFTFMTHFYGGRVISMNLKPGSRVGKSSRFRRTNGTVSSTVPNKTNDEFFVRVRVSRKTAKKYDASHSRQHGLKG